METDIIYQTDAISGLRGLPADSADCIVTSPPYWQLRDYGVDGIEWADGWFGQLGLEPTREAYIGHLLIGLPQKSLCNIPGRFADEMILRGWTLRNEIIWHKPSCIPSSVKDRFTVDFEKIFFFTKSPKYDFRQQFEPYAESTPARYRRGYNVEGKKNAVYRGQYGVPAGLKEINPKGRNKRTVWRVATGNNRDMHFASYPAKLIETPIEAGCPPGGIVLDPFIGSGTTAIVARRLGRHYIGIEPNPEYVSIINRRLKTG